MTAATVATMIAMEADRTMKDGSMTMLMIGAPPGPFANIVKAVNRPMPRVTPPSEPIIPIINPSKRNIVLAVLSLIPIALRIPSCRDFCTTLIIRTAAIATRTKQERRPV